MKKEFEGIEPEATQGTIKNITDTVGGIIGRRGRASAPVWEEFEDVLEPGAFNGFNFFVVSSRLFPEFYDSELPLALVQLYKPVGIGQREVTYKIMKEEEKLRIDRYDRIQTQSYKNHEDEIEEVKTREEEREAGRSFVSEPEALGLLQTLIKINEKHRR